MKKILVVDDNQDNRTTIELLLEGFENIEVLSANDGKEACQIAKEKSPNLIFMDIMMPVMNGIDATKAIREFDKSVMIVAISALDDEQSKNTMLMMGCEDYIRKPIDNRVFKKRVENYLELIDLRGQRFESDGVSHTLFSKDVYSRITTFRISSKKSLAEFWEYYLVDENKSTSELSDCVRMIYAIASFILRTHKPVVIYEEEDESYLFLTIDGVGTIDKGAIKNVLMKHYENKRFIIDENRLSFMLIKSNRESTVNIEPKPIQNEEPTPQQEAKKEERQVTDTETKMMGGDMRHNISAEEFLANTPIDLESKVEMLEDIEDRLDSVLYEFDKEFNADFIHVICDHLNEFSATIEEMVQFQHLAYAISSLSSVVRGTDPDRLLSKHYLLRKLLFNILQDMTSWRKAIFTEKSAKDIHYLDSSLLSSCMQIEMELKDTQAESSDNDLELF